jgi:hypothetical protein
LDERRREAKGEDLAARASLEGASRPIHTSRGGGYAFLRSLEAELKLAEVREGFFGEAARFGIGIGRPGF